MSEPIYNGANDIATGIANFLKDLYPQYRRYDGNPKQEVILPCFIVEQITGRYAKRVGLSSERGFTTTTFTVHFLSTEKAELREVAQNVSIRMRQVEIPDGPISLRAMQTTFSEDQVSITFRARVSVSVQGDKAPFMKRLDVTERVK